MPARHNSRTGARHRERRTAAMAERQRRLTVNPVEEDAEETFDQSAVDAAGEARTHTQSSSNGMFVEALLAQAEEAALDHGSVDRIYRRGSSSGRAKKALV